MKGLFSSVQSAASLWLLVSSSADRREKIFPLPLLLFLTWTFIREIKEKTMTLFGVLWEAN